MTTDDILRMAREVADKDKVDPVSGQTGEEFVTMTPEELERFAALVAADERDECAKVAKAISDKYAFGHYGNEVDTADEIEAAIRARGTK